MLYEDVILCV